jgi:two-component system, OmpR family, sensor histidine kinase KdpD
MTSPDDEPADGHESTAGDSSEHESVEDAGRFRVYLGAAPGVGKTYAMLNEGRRRKQRGTDVVIGFVECHGRKSTEELIEGLEAVPPRRVDYRGSQFQEMDLDAVLELCPQVVLVDELAHTNVPGAGGHDKRWQDVLELLDAEVDVITTVNIQHLESIADAVERIIEVPIRERVPDWVVRRADQIELVDSSPEQLRRRMVHGNIYPPDKVPQALTNYFRTDNLTALRELALRFLADETEDQLLEYLRGQRKDAVWETHERILVGVTAAPGTDVIVRRASRMAGRIKADLQVLHVLVGREGRRSRDDQMTRVKQTAADVGAIWDEVRGDDPAQALIDFARQGHITQIVVGSSGRSRWQELIGGGSTVRKISRLAAAADIDVHIIARRDPYLGTDVPFDAASES